MVVMRRRLLFLLLLLLLMMFESKPTAARLSLEDEHTRQFERPTSADVHFPTVEMPLLWGEGERRGGGDERGGEMREGMREGGRVMRGVCLFRGGTL